MRLSSLGVLSAAAALCVGATGARADVLTLNGGWDPFYYLSADVFDPTVGASPLYDNTSNPTGEWDFTVAAPAFLKITDAYYTGDWYDLTINGADQGPTSFPTVALDFQPDFEQAFHDPNFSSAYYYLQPGSYVVTGVALLAPYGYGVGGIALSSDVPEPAAWTLMLSGLAGIGGLTRRRGRGAGAPA